MLMNNKLGEDEDIDVCTEDPFQSTSNDHTYSQIPSTHIVPSLPY